ncbi:MAG TPA: RNA methyltransferase [Candidatus Kapabacteria bacterium]|nr:RNA methyltransferase [Candidatus Kapabacteria bacterium]
MKYWIISNPTVSDLYPFTSLKLPKESNYFIAESEKVVASLLACNLDISSLYLTQEHFDEKLPLIEQHQQETEANIIIASKKEMEQIVGYPLHQGIIASAPIPKETTLEELLATSQKPHLFIILDTIADAENVGALYRTALAMNATAIILDASSVSPWIRRAVRVSMGAVFKLPTITSANPLETIEYLNGNGITTIAAEITPNSKPVWDVNFNSDVAIVFGSEGYGIRNELLEACQHVVDIPMTKDVQSLNVTVAQGMFLYEVARQRTKL